MAEIEVLKKLKYEVLIKAQEVKDNQGKDYKGLKSKTRRWYCSRRGRKILQGRQTDMEFISCVQKN